MPGGNDLRSRQFPRVFAISTNAPGYPGGAMQIDVSGRLHHRRDSDLTPSAPNLGECSDACSILAE